MTAQKALALAINALLNWREEFARDMERFSESEELKSVAENAQKQVDEIDEAIATLEALQQIIEGDR